MNAKEKFYITMPIAYANAAPHMGHALEFVQADVLARYHRLLDEDVFFLSGTDEHGAKIMRAAEASGKTSAEFVDEISEKFKDLARKLNTSNDDFIRTSDKERHWPGAQEMWRKVAAAGKIYKKKYSGLYCVGCESFVKESDLIDGKCQYHGKEPEKVEEENWFLKLSDYGEILKKKIESDELKIVPESKKNEMLALIESGLEDISISRQAEKLPWGIPVSDDASQVMYVWFDALPNYITALGYGLPRSAGDGDDEKFKKYWPADLHLVGKDILRFHATIWPAMLMAAGLELPKQIFVHGFITSGGKKMSKSLGNVVDPLDLIKEYGTDAARYYFLREITPFEDGDLTEEKFKDAYNANLANGLGNLVSRVMKMSEGYLDGGERKETEFRVAPAAETRFQGANGTLGDTISKWMEKYEFNKAMDEIWKKIAELDLQIQTTQPFKLVKTDAETAKKIIRELVVGLSEIAEALNPFLPETAQKISQAILANKMPEPLFLRK